MIACIIGNVYSGLMIVALQGKLVRSEEEANSGMWILWRASYAKLKTNSAKAIEAALRLVRLHKQFCLKYPEAFMLNPIKVMSKPPQTKAYLPLLKVFNKSAVTMNDADLLSGGDFQAKMKVYLTMKKSFYNVNRIDLDRHLEVSLSKGLYSLTCQQAICYNDLSTRMSRTADLDLLFNYRRYTRHSKALLLKAQTAMLISAKLLRVKQPSQIVPRVKELRYRMEEAVDKLIRDAYHKDEVEQKELIGKTHRHSSLAERAKIKKQNYQQVVARRASNKLRLIAEQREEAKADGRESEPYSNLTYRLPEELTSVDDSSFEDAAQLHGQEAHLTGTRISFISERSTGAFAESRPEPEVNSREDRGRFGTLRKARSDSKTLFENVAGAAEYPAASKETSQSHKIPSLKSSFKATSLAKLPYNLHVTSHESKLVRPGSPSDNSQCEPECSPKSATQISTEREEYNDTRPSILFASNPTKLIRQKIPVEKPRPNKPKRPTDQPVEEGLEMSVALEKAKDLIAGKLNRIRERLKFEMSA
jgi:hypothetical protein